MNSVVKFPDPVDELYRARRTLRDPDASDGDIMASIEKLEAIGDGEDKWLCRQLRRAMAQEAAWNDADSQEQAREMAGIIYGADRRFMPLKSQREIDNEQLLRVVTWASMFLAGATFWLGVIWLVGQAWKAWM